MAISGVTSTVMIVEKISSQPLAADERNTLYCVVAVNTPVLYVDAFAPGIEVQDPVLISH